MVKISVIVPVYNTGKYLEPCLDSLAAQTLKDAEFILVDDGSTDLSGQICDTYAAKDSRFKVIHKSNAGVSFARNTGIDAAQGEFIGFVDSDDTVKPDMFEGLCALADEYGADIVLCDSVAIGKDIEELETINALPESITLKKSDITPEILLETAGAAWRCIYKKEMLIENNILFPLGLRFSEDRIFNIYAMGAAKVLHYQKEVYYNRLLHDESAVHRFYANYFDIIKDAANRTKDAVRNAWEDKTQYQTAYLRQFINGAIAAINNYFYKTSTLSHAERREKVRLICGDKELRDAIRKTGYGGVRGKWILNGNVTLLCMCAKYLNKKHGR